MLTEFYIAALLVDEDLPDEVWDLWNTGETDNEAACIAWMLIAIAQPPELLSLMQENGFWY